ncbi:DUF5776 domain-containing protein [Apilactobacillus nanyangensis]|uniref:DUF5776 domain-containing protein n=1 Tax=Apilactobacillus nanyangensis TaxID=2799579 RepID=A0ABT0HXG5_9LACO|nr:DUF5776 domain-containing protein [Apilactobacillus nanyangensis]MCK8611414.1 DUF5776 domain-containing protein [Apilactobacillus nanyangensis]
MQYNKKKFNKIKDKKVMKKVKKQWVVMSLSTFATVGGLAYTMSFSHVAHADTSSDALKAVTQTSSASSSGSGYQQVASSATSVNSDVNASYANQSAVSLSVDSNVAANKAIDSDAQAGFNNGLGVNSAYNSQAASSIASSIAAIQAAAQSSGNSTQASSSAQSSGSTQSSGSSSSSSQPISSYSSDYTNASSQAAAYKAVIDRAGSDAFAGNGNQVSTISDVNEQNYYNAAYNGAMRALAAYNLLTHDQGTGTQDYTSYQQNVSSSQKPNDAYNSAIAYEQQLLAKFNGKNNTTVKLNQNGQITIPSQNDSSITSFNTYTPNSALYLTYQYGVNYFLTQQGIKDAKAGKWTGISKNQGLVYDANHQLSFPADNYTPSADSTNAYDQAYLGAQQAMNDQWDPVYDTINGGGDGTNWHYVLDLEKNANNLNYIGGTSYYRAGYDSVAQEIYSGKTAFVHNSWQFQRALAGNYYPNWKLSDIVNGKWSGYSAYNDAWGKTVNATNVKLVNDIDFQGAPYTEYWPTMYHLQTLVVDGQNHQADFHGCLDQFYADAGVTPKLIIQNFQAAYSYNYYGFLKINQPGTVIYNNVNYVGAQMLSDFPAGGNDIRFIGNINEINVSSYQTSLNTGVHPTEGNGNQENMEIQNLLLYPGTHYFGTVAPDYGNNVIKLSGSLTMNDGSQMTLVPRGNGGYYARNGSNYGIVVTNGANLNINKGATLQVIPDKWNGSGTFANGIYTYGNVNVNGGTLDIETNAPSYFYNAAMYVDQTGQVNISNGGLVKVQSQNLGNTSTGSYGILYNNNGQINVNNLGNLNVSADGSGQVNLIAGPLSITNPGQNNITLDLTGNSNAQSTLSNNKIDAYTSLVTYGNRSGAGNLSTTLYPSQILYSFHLNNNKNSYVDASANPGSFTQGTPNYLQIATVPAVYFVGPMTPVKNQDGTYSLTGYAQVGGHKENDNEPIYIQAGYGTNNSYTGLTYLPGNIRNKTTSKDTNVYSQTMDVPSNYNYEIMKYTVQMPRDYDPTKNPYVGILLRYGVDGIDTTAQVQTGQYVSSQHRYDLDKNGNLIDVGQQVITSGNYNDINNGVGDALTDVSNGNNNQQNINQYKINPNYTSGYNSVVAGYNAFNNGAPDPTTNPASMPKDTASNTTNQSSNNVVNDPAAYIQGYNQARADAAGTQKGINDFINGNAQTTNPNATTQYNNNYNNAYYNALQGYNDKGNGAVSPLSQSVSYLQGFNARQNFTDGQNAAYSNTVDTNREQNDPAYAVGVSAFNDAKSQVLTGSHTASGQGQIYTDAYNQALQNLTNNYNDGSNAFLNNGANNTNENSPVATKVANQGYKDALDGYNGVTNHNNQNLPGYILGQSIKSGVTDLLNGNADNANQSSNQSGYEKGYQDALSAFTSGVTSGNTTSSDNQTNAYKDGLAAAANANQAIAKAEADLESGNFGQLGNDDVNDSSAYKTAYNAYKQAYDDIKNGRANSSANQSAIYQVVYNNAFNKIKSQYNKGVSDFLKNSQDTSNKAFGYTQAYSDAQQAYNDFNDRFSKNGNKIDGISKITSNNPSSAYQQAFNALLDAKRGASDAKSQLSNNYNRPADSTNPDYMEGYNGVRAAYADASLNTPSTDLTGKSREYVDAYNDEKNEASAMYSTASQEFLAGKDNPTAKDPISIQAFQDTSYGYQTGLSTSDVNQLTDAQRNNKGFMAGFNAAQAISAGYKKSADVGAANNYADKSYETASTNLNHQSEEYQVYEAYKGARDGFEGHDQEWFATLAYKQAYQKALAQARAQSEQGAKDYLKGLVKQSTDSQYSTGYDKAKAGFAQFISEYKGYNNSPQSLNVPKTLSTDFSYQDGYEAARSAYSYLYGNTLSDLNPDDAASIGYNQASRGYNAAISDPNANTQIAPEDASYSAAYKLGYNNVITQVIQGYNNAISDQTKESDNNSVRPNDPNYDKSQSYLGAVAGIRAAQDASQPSTADSSYPLSYQKSYAKAYQLWKNNLTTGANSFVNGEANGNGSYNGQETNAGKQADKTALNAGYSSALKGFQDAVNGSGKKEPTNSTLSSAYDTGYNAYQDALAGINAAKQSNSTGKINVGNPTPDQAFVDGYNAYIQAKSDVPSNKNVNDSSADAMYQTLYPVLNQQLTTSYQSGRDAYLNGYDVNATTNSSDPLFVLGFNDAKLGVLDAVNNNNKTSNNSAYTYAYGQFKSTSSSKGYVNGYKLAQTATSNSTVTDQIGVDAFRGAGAGYTASWSNAPYQIDSTQSLSYNIAFQKAYADGQRLHEQGANEYLSGTSVASSSSNGYPIQAENDGFTSAKNGYQFGLTGAKPSDDQMKNPSFMMGYNAAVVSMGALNGLDENTAKSKVINTDGAYSDANNNLHNYFSDTQQGFTDGTSKTLTDTSKSYSPSYLTGYYAARGTSDFTSNKPNTTQSNFFNNLNDATSVQIAYNTGYNQAVNGFNEAVNGGSLNSPTLSEQAGFDSYQNSSLKTQIDTYANQARSDFSGSPAMNLANANPAKNNNSGLQLITAYTNAYTNAETAYVNGVNAYLNGTNVNATATQHLVNGYDFYYQGFIDAKNAYTQTLTSVNNNSASNNSGSNNSGSNNSGSNNSGNNNSGNNNNTSNASAINTTLASLIQRVINTSASSSTQIQLPASNNDGNNLGYNQANGLINAFKDLKTSGTLVPQSSSDVNYQTAATAMLQAQSDLLTKSHTDLTNKGLLYNNAYRLVYQYSQDEYTNGQNSVLLSTPLDNDGFAIQGASNTRSGFVDALSGLNKINGDNPQYSAGYDAAQTIKQAYADTMNDPTQTKNYKNSDGSNDDNSNNVEAAVKLALADFKNNSTRSNQDPAISAKYAAAAYNAAMSSIQDAALNGMSNYLFNQRKLDKTFTTVEQEGFDGGYQDAQTGFALGLDSKATLDTTKSQYYQNGFNEARHVLQAVQDATVDGPQGINSPKVIETAYQEAYQATLDAQNAIKNGSNTDTVTDSDSNNPHDNVYKEAYKLAFDGNQSSYMSGAKLFAQSKNSPNKLDMQTSGYNKANDGYHLAQQYFASLDSSLSINQKIDELNNQFNGLPDIVKTNKAYAVGYQSYIGSLKGYQAAIDNANNSDEKNKYAATDNGDEVSYAETLREGAAYNGAVDAFNDYMAHDVANSPKHNEDPTYAAAYTKAATDVANKVQSGADSFLSNANYIINANPQGIFDQAQAKGATDASNGFKAAQTLSQTDLSAKSKAFQAGYNAKTQALNGLAASSGNNRPTDPTAQVAYDAARDARAALTNNSVITDFSNKSEVYKFIYESVVSDYQKGMNKFKAADNSANDSDAATGYSDESDGYAAGLAANGDVDLRNKSVGYIDGFNLGKASATAYQASQGTQTDANSNNQYTADTNGVSAFDGAQDGYKDAISDKPSRTTSRAANEASQKAYSDAYDKAYQTARNKMQSGINAFTNYDGSDDLDGNGDANNTNKPTSAVLLEQAAIDKGYLDAKAGYKDALNYVKDHPNDSSNDNTGKISQSSQAYDNGYQLGLDVARSLEYTRSHANVLQDTSATDPNASTDQARSAFNGAVKGFADGQDTATQHILDSNQSGAYKKAYTIASVEASQQYEQGKQKFLTGVLNDHSKDDTNVDDVAYNRGYNETSDGYTDGMKIPQVQRGNSTGYVAGYNKGTAIANSFQSAQEGNSEYTGEDKSTGAFSPQETFDAAKAGFEDAQALNEPNANSDKTISYQNAYNLAYNEYKDAIAKGSQQYLDGNGSGTTDSNNFVDKATARGFAITNDGFNDGYTSANNNSPHTPTNYTDATYTRGYNAGTGASAFVYAKQYDSTNADQSTGYQEASDGFNFAASGNDESQIPADKRGQAAFMKGFDVYTQYKRGIEDGSIKDGTKQSNDEDYGDAYRATQSARQNFFHYSTVDNSGKTPIYQSIYSVKSKDFLKQYEAGKNAYLTGSTNEGTDIHAQGYQDAVNGFSDGFGSKGNPQTQDKDNIGYTESYKAGQSAYKGYLAALADKTNNTSGDSSSYATDGFNGSVQALTDGFNINNPGLPSGMSVSMQNGYNAMIQQAQQAVEDGLNSFAQSLPNAHSITTGSGNSLDKLQKAAYDTTKDGYEAGLAGNFDQTMSNNKAYVQGYNLGKGANEFLNGKPKSDSDLDDSVESQGYKDAKSGYDAAINSNGDVVPVTSLTPQQQADKVFMAGYTAHVNAHNAAIGTYNEQTNVETDQYSQYGANAVRDALTDATTTGRRDVTGQPKAYQDAYNEYFAKIYGNFDDIKDSVNNANSGNSNVDMSHESNVTGDYFNAIKQYLNKNTSSLPKNIATDKGIEDATKGFMNGISNSPENLPYAGYTPAYNVGLKLSAGFLAAKRDVTKNTADTSNSDETTKDDINQSYDGAVAGYKAALNGGKSSDDSPNDSLPYSASYNVAYGIAHQNLLSGQNDFLTSAGTNQPSDSNEMEKSSYNFGYNQTRDGYKDAIDGKSQASNTSASYLAGYNAATNAKSGRDDANAGRSPQQTNNAQYMAGYNATIAARHDAVMTNNQPTDVTNQPLVYQDVYNDEYAKDNKAYIDGYNNYVTNGNKVSDGSFQQMGYEDTQNGYADGLKDNDEASSNYGYKQGYEMGKAFKDAYKTAYNDPTQIHTNQYSGSDDAVNTYDAAVQAFKQVSSEKGPEDVSQQSEAYQRAYKTAYDQSIAEMNAGSQRFINGLSNKHSDGTNADDRAYNQGYVNTQSGYQDGFAAKSVNDLTDANKASATYMIGYNIGKGAQDFVEGVGKGTATVTATNIPIDNPQGNYDDGYQQAQTGYEQRKNGVTRDQLTQAQLNNPSFMSGFNMSDEIQQGIQDAITNPTSSFNSNSPHDRAYRAVLDALNDFKQVKRSDVSQQPAAYADAYNDVYAQIVAQANNGSQKYLNGGQNDKKQSQNILDQAYTFGYNNSQSGSEAVYNAANNGKLPSTNDLSDAQRNNASFMTGFNNANGAVAFDNNSYATDNNSDYQAGYADAAKGYDVGMSGVTESQLTPEQQNDKSFMLGFNKSNEALKGYQLAQQEFGTQDNTHLTNSDKDTAFSGAQAGFIDAQLGRPMSQNKVSVVYDKAYQRAYAEWQSHVQSGALDGVNNKANQDAGMNPVDKTAYDLGYNSAATALKDAKANAIKFGTVQGFDKLDKDVYDNVYNAYSNGYIRGYNKLSKDNNSSDAVYSSAYDQGYTLGSQNAPAGGRPTSIDTNVAQSDKVVKDFTDGVKKAPSGKSQKAKYDGNYNDIILGFRSGIANKKVSQKDQDNFYFNQGIELARIVKIAIKDAKKIKKLTDTERRQQPAAYVKAFDAYKAGVLAEKNNVKNRKAKRINYNKMGTMAEYAFKQGFQVERKQQMSDGTRAGKARGSKHYYIPKLKNQNVDYVKSYEKAYKNEIKRRLPKYVYNIKAVYAHRAVRFTTGNRIIFYAKRPRYAAHVFKVLGVAFYKNGIPRYRVSGGGILTATPSAMRNAYYSRKNNARHYRVIRPTGVWLHDSKKFSVGNRIKHFRRNSVIKIRKVIKYHGITRLYINSHQYITSNKTFVKKTK